MGQKKRIFLAGHRGLVGGALLRQLAGRGDADIILRSRAELDLRDQAAVREFMRHERPDAVILAAAKVGGIMANSNYPADFIQDNLLIQCNTIGEAFAVGVRELLFLGSSCIYPRLAAQPMGEASLLTGALEPTNEPYAVAKIAGIKLCESYNRQHGTDYRAVMPTNLYGPGDNFHPEQAHVLPALIRRFSKAVLSGAGEVVIWGSGAPKREFLHVDDMAAASLFVMDLDRETYAANTDPMLSHINIGTGKDISIAQLAHMVAEIAGYSGRIVFDETKPDGAPRKLLDVSRLESMGWQASIDLAVGLAQTYQWYLEQPGAKTGLS